MGNSNSHTYIKTNTSEHNIELPNTSCGVKPEIDSLIINKHRINIGQMLKDYDSVRLNYIFNMATVRFHDMYYNHTSQRYIIFMISTTELDFGVTPAYHDVYHVNVYLTNKKRPKIFYSYKVSGKHAISAQCHINDLKEFWDSTLNSPGYNHKYAVLSL